MSWVCITYNPINAHPGQPEYLAFGCESLGTQQGFCLCSDPRNLPTWRPWGCLPTRDPGREPRSTPGVRWSQKPRRLGGNLRQILAHSQTSPTPSPITTVPGLKHVTSKTTAPRVLQHLHIQADLTLHLCVRVHTAQVDPAVNSWRAQALTFLALY